MFEKSNKFQIKKIIQNFGLFNMEDMSWNE